MRGIYDFVVCIIHMLAALIAIILIATMIRIYVGD